MNEIHIRDRNFFSDQYPDRPNPYFKWVWDRQPKDSYITVFTDCFLDEVLKSKSAKKVAWLIEPPSISEHIYKKVMQLYPRFDMVLTFWEDLLPIDNKFVYMPYGTTWIHEPQRAIYPKSKNVSIIVSEKRITEGHKLRHACVNRFGKSMDVLGRGYKPFDQKVEGLKDYRYSVVIENSRVNSYFSEKLLDCLLTGTVPVYWGYPKVAEFFDPKGFIFFDRAEQLGPILDKMSVNDYLSRMEAIKSNYEKALGYISLEEHLWKRSLNTFFTNNGLGKT
jgi:hypothetical protein